MTDVTLGFPFVCPRSRGLRGAAGGGGDNGETPGPGGGDETEAGTVGLVEIPMTREPMCGVAWGIMKGACEHPGQSRTKPDSSRRTLTGADTAVLWRYSNNEKKKE